MKPLRNESAGLQPARDQFVKLPAKDAPIAGGPGVGGLGDNDVVSFRTQLEDRAGIFLDNAGERVGQYAAIPGIKQSRSTDDGATAFGDGQGLNRVRDHGTSADS